MYGLTRRLAAAARNEARELRDLRPRVGIRRALEIRAKANLGLEGVDATLVDGLAGAAHEERLARQALERELEAAVARIARLEDEDAGGRLARLEDEDAGGRLAQLELNGAEDRLARQVLAMNSWAEHLEPLDTPITVVVTTRERPDWLRRALGSVLRQTHERWELVVACDFEDPATLAVLDELGEERLVRVDRNGRNRAEALNLALGRATGELVAYLDDDNLMLPHYLRALAWAFAEHPEAEVAYSTLVRQRDGDTLPTLELHPWDPSWLRRCNLADHNAVAHRRGIGEERFAEDLFQAEDWERLDRITTRRPPLRLPILAGVYSTDAPGRMSDRSDALPGYRKVQRRIMRRRPLRVLATYVDDELEALVDQGAELAYYQDARSPSPVQVERIAYPDLDSGAREFVPDIVMLHGAAYAESQVPGLEALGLPFGVRVHVIDHEAERVARLRDHPQCIGVWSHPSDEDRMPGVHELPPIFTSVRDMPPPAAERDLVVSISARPPEQDWPLLFDAFGRLTGVPRRVVAAIAPGWTDLPAELAERAAAIEDPPLVQIDVTRRDAHALLARAALLVYTLRPDVRFGTPTPVVEALCAGCSVVLPDRPACRELAGPGFRGYRTASDVERHAREVLAGGPAIEAERRANMAYGRERFCAPELGERFHLELREALEAHRFEVEPLGLPA